MYINYAELIARYPLAQKWNDQPAMVSSHLIHYAEKQLDAMLSTHFTTPFTPAHPTIKDLTLDLCKYRILLDQDAKKAKSIWDIITDQIEMLKNGEMAIATESGTEIVAGSAADEVWSNTKDYHPTHSMLGDKSPYTIVDSSMLSDLESERS
jgi:phage gp36-like protein